MWIRFLSYIVILALLPSFAQAQGNNSSCDRACLEGFVEQYLDAAIAHDPGLLPLWRIMSSSRKTA